MKKIIILISAGLLLLLSSCTLWNMLMGTNIPAAVMGALLSVDSSGRFTEDIVYDYGAETVTYKADGSYETLTLGYSAADGGYVTSSGMRGTYTWDADTMMLVKTYTGQYNSGTESWDPLTRKVSYTAYFSTQNSDDAFVKSTDTADMWQYDYSVTYDDSSTITIYRRWVINGTTLTYTYRRINRDSGGQVTSGWDEERTYSVAETFPAGIQWGPGTAVTFNTSMSAKYRSWSTANDNWGNWSTADTSLVVVSLSNAGTFVFNTIASSARTPDCFDPLLKEDGIYEN